MSDTKTNQTGDSGTPANLAVLGGARPAEPSITSRDVDTLNKQAPEPFPDRVKRIAESIAIMRVTTVIGTLTGVVGQDDLKHVTSITLDSANQQAASLSINMVLGDTTLLLSPGFVDNPTYMKLHEDAVKQAREIRGETVELLKTIWHELSDLLKTQ